MPCNPPALSSAAWQPSKIRQFRIYSGLNSYSPESATRPALYKWSPKHPLEENAWWVDASGLCKDIDDTIQQVGYSVLCGDGRLFVDTWGLSECQRWAGLWLRGGTPNTPYRIRVHLTFKSSGAFWGGDVHLQVVALGAVPAPNPALITNNGDIVLLGGIPFPTGNQP
jgi:hypothetical protein